MKKELVTLVDDRPGSYFEIEKSYNWGQIEREASESNFDIEEHGDDIIGSTFVCLKHREISITISFVLSGYNEAYGNIYTCCYTSLK